MRLSSPPCITLQHFVSPAVTFFGFPLDRGDGDRAHARAPLYPSEPQHSRSLEVTCAHLFHLLLSFVFFPGQIRIQMPRPSAVFTAVKRVSRGFHWAHFVPHALRSLALPASFILFTNFAFSPHSYRARSPFRCPSQFSALAWKFLQCPSLLASTIAT